MCQLTSVVINVIYKCRHPASSPSPTSIATKITASSRSALTMAMSASSSSSAIAAAFATTTASSRSTSTLDYWHIIDSSSRQFCFIACSSYSASITTAGAWSSHPVGIGYSFIATSSNSTNTSPSTSHCRQALHGQRAF